MVAYKSKGGQIYFSLVVSPFKLFGFVFIPN